MKFGVICHCKWLMPTRSIMNIDEQNVHYHSKSYEINVALEYYTFHYKNKTLSGEKTLCIHYLWLISNSDIWQYILGMWKQNQHIKDTAKK